MWMQAFTGAGGGPLAPIVRARTAIRGNTFLYCRTANLIGLFQFANAIFRVQKAQTATRPRASVCAATAPKERTATRAFSQENPFPI